jgi:hypothetical protein
MGNAFSMPRPERARHFLWQTLARQGVPLSTEGNLESRKVGRCAAWKVAPSAL